MKFPVAVGLAAIALLRLSTGATAEVTQTCQFNPELGLPNPLGMRAFVTITEEDGNTTFLFEQFPSNAGDGEVPVTIASNRILTFYETELEDARQLMLQKPSYYSELVGYSDPDGFGPVNDVLSCSP